MYGYIYKFTVIPTNLIYVGQRKSESIDDSYWGSGKKWKEILKLYGKENIKREILEYCNTKEELNLREKYWINKLNSRDPEIGYNISIGGESFFTDCHHSDDSKLKISKALHNISKGRTFSLETRKKMSESAKKRGPTNLGKHWIVSDEGRKNMSKGKIGHSVSDLTRKKISEANKVSLFGKKQSPETVDKRINSSKITYSKMTKEELSNRTLKGWETRRKNKNGNNTLSE